MCFETNGKTNKIIPLNTQTQYQNIVNQCKNIFFLKNKDYGTAWTIMRPSSLTDQLFIKAKRIRTLETTEAKVQENIENEYVGLINYSIMSLLVCDKEFQQKYALENTSIPTQTLENLYDTKTKLPYETMLAKNHDYGEAWREMRITSLTDLILAKILRTKQIEDNQYKTNISEGVENNYIDIINYAIFSLILLK